MVSRFGVEHLRQGVAQPTPMAVYRTDASLTEQVPSKSMWCMGEGGGGSREYRKYHENNRFTDACGDIAIAAVDG